MWTVSDSSQLVVGLPSVGHSRLLAVLDNLTFVETDFWPRENIIVHQQTNVSRKNRAFETFMENVLLTPNILPPPGDLSIVHISQKIVFSLWKAFFRHPEQKNRFFEDNVFYKKCSFDPANRQASKQTIFFPRLFSTRKRTTGVTVLVWRVTQQCLNILLKM